MSTERDTTRIVRSWLRTDEHESADRVLDVVLARLDATPQRRLMWPARRFVALNNIAKVAIAAAAVVIVAVIAFNFLPRPGGVGPSVSPSQTAQPTPSPKAAAVFPPKGALATGAKVAMTLNGVPLSLTVPDSGWISNGEWGIDKGASSMAPDSVGFIFWVDETPIGVYADPCRETRAAPVKATVADLAAAVAKIPGTTLVSGPTDMTVGGHPGKHVVIGFPEDIGCAPEHFLLWYAPGSGHERYASQLGSTIGVWIVDVNGTLVWIDGETFKGAGPGPALELQQVIDSIKFG